MKPRASPGRRAASPRGAQAVLTPPGRGGIAVIRCVGQAAETALERCFKPRLSPPGEAVLSPPREAVLSPPRERRDTSPLPPPGRIAYGHITDDDDQPVDEVIVYRASAEAFEVNCHGGPAAVQAVSRRLAALGLEPVDPDRLMELEGLPRLEREARRALGRATTPAAARILLDQLNGTLAEAVGRARQDLRAGRTGGAQAVLEDLVARWFTCGRFLADPPRIAIAGRPNAGKSTLLNRLAGADRALTSPLPGTTRDTVEAEAALEGVPVVLVDTAGLRQAAGSVEREGVERARRELASAAAVVYLVDATGPVTAEDEAAFESLGSRAVIVWSKVDAAEAAAHLHGPAQAGLAVSALTGRGLGALASQVLACIGWGAPPAGAAVPFSMDQVRALGAARQALLAGDPARAEKVLGELLA